MTSPRPDVTVVIPTHNRRALVADAIESVRAQRDVDWELVVVDDASTDGTDRYLAEQDDVRAIVFEANRERASARNAGLTAATGRYVYFLDSDDRIAEGGLARLMRFAGQRPGRVIVGGITNAPGAQRDLRALHIRKPTTGTWKDVLFGWAPQVGQMLVPADAAAAISGFDTRLIHVEDVDFNLRLSHQQSFAVFPDIVMEYLTHTGQAPPPQAHEWDVEVRRHFVERLDPSERRVGEKILRSRDHYHRAQEQYAVDAYRSAFAGFVRALASWPSLVRSGMLGRYVMKMLLKSALGALLPAGLAVKLRSRLAADRKA